MSNSELKILPLKPLEIQDKSDKKFHPHLPSISRNHGTLCLIIGSCGSGKTCLMANILCNQAMFRGAFENVYFFSPTVDIDDSCRFFRDCFNCYTEYKDSILKNIIATQMSYPKNEMPRIAVVADDSGGLLSKNFFTWLTRYRHINSNVFLSIQNFKMLQPSARSNANAVILMNGIVNNKELEKIDEEYSAPYKNTLMYCYKKFANKPYSFLYLKNRKNPPEMYQNLTTKIDWKKYTKQARLFNKKKDYDSESDEEI